MCRPSRLEREGSDLFLGILEPASKEYVKLKGGGCYMASERAQDSLRGAVIAIVAAAIGALGSLGGTYLANDNARSQLASQLAHEDMVREANVRRDVYKRFIVAVHEFESDLGDVSLATEQKRFPKLAKELAQDSVRVNTVSTELLLVGSARASELAIRITDKLNRTSASVPRLSQSEINHLKEDAHGDLNKFLDVVLDETKKQPLSR